MADLNDKGRKENAAQPLGEQKGIESERAEWKTAERERHSAGPDGPNARDVTRQDGFLNREGDPAEGKRR